MATAIGTLGAVDTLAVGNVNTRLITDLANTKILGGYSNTGSLDYTGYRNGFATSSYVATGSGLHIIALDFQSQGTNLILEIGYCDADPGQANGSVPTNPVYLYGSALASGVIASNNGQGSWFTGINMDFVVPAGKYLFTKSNNSAVNIRMYAVDLP